MDGAKITTNKRSLRRPIRDCLKAIPLPLPLTNAPSPHEDPLAGYGVSVFKTKDISKVCRAKTTIFRICSPEDF